MCLARTMLEVSHVTDIIIVHIYQCHNQLKPYQIITRHIEVSAITSHGHSSKSGVPFPIPNHRFPRLGLECQHTLLHTHILWLQRFIYHHDYEVYMADIQPGGAWRFMVIYPSGLWPSWYDPPQVAYQVYYYTSWS